MTFSFLLVYRWVVAHWRAITLLLIPALGTFLIARAEFFLLFVIALLFTASQIFWIRRIIDVGERLLPGQPGRARVAVIVNLAYLFVIAYSYPTTIGQGHTFRIGFYRLPNIVAEAVFWWWFVGSMLAFVLVIMFGVVDRAARAAAWLYRRARQTAQRHVTAYEPHDHAIGERRSRSDLTIGHSERLGSYRYFAYSALACFRMGMSGSASGNRPGDMGDTSYRLHG